MDNELIKFCLLHMCSKEHIHNIYTNHNIYFKTKDSYQMLQNRLVESDIKIDKAFITEYFRKHWLPSPFEKHLKNLKSGLLEGHSWHGAMPSMLHLSFQNKVRQHINGEYDLNSLINIGTDIMKHEYFMVCVHDLCESYLIQHFPDCIPPIRNKSISDFVFRGIPYDLKISNYINNYSKDFINHNKEQVILQMLQGADILRIRKQANTTFNNWGQNRFYLLVEDQNRWLSNPEDVLNELIFEAQHLSTPLAIQLEENVIINCQLIAI